METVRDSSTMGGERSLDRELQAEKARQAFLVDGRFPANRQGRRAAERAARRQHGLRRVRQDAGTSAVEYGLMVAAIAAVIVAVVFGLGQVIKTQFGSVSSQITTCSPDPSKCPDGGAAPTATK